MRHPTTTNYTCTYTAEQLHHVHTTQYRKLHLLFHLIHFREYCVNQNMDVQSAQYCDSSI